MKSMFDYNEKYLDYDATDQKLVVQDEDDSPSRAYLTISQVSRRAVACVVFRSAAHVSMSGGQREVRGEDPSRG
jgi:hypothetical protein